jgi:hypothetical protein
MACAADAAPPLPALTGEWGGPQVRMSLTATGGKMEFDCASATIDAPVRPDPTGKFSAPGRHEAFTGGPTPADVAPPTTAAHFEGHVEGDTMHLTIHRKGETATQEYTLQRGRRVKIIRCM